MNALFDLTGKVALVTGGSRGLGLEIARAFAAHGADVAIASRKLEACRKAAEDISEQYGVQACPVAFHAGKWDECERLLGIVDRELGRLDVLVNNAGASPPYNSLADISEMLWAKVVDLNMKGPFRLAILAAERMANAEVGGSIINISSTAVVQPDSGALPYAMAKAGLHVMSHCMAHSYAGKVRVNVIMPGPFRTDVSKAWPQAMTEHIRAAVPMGRAGEPGEIAGAAIYLASEASSYTNGAVIKVDGGWTYGVG